MPEEIVPRSPSDPGSAVRGTGVRGREGPGRDVPADRAAAPAGRRAERAVVLLDDVGFGASSAFGGPLRDADGRAAGRRAG